MIHFEQMRKDLSPLMDGYLAVFFTDTFPMVDIRPSEVISRWLFRLIEIPVKLSEERTYTDMETDNREHRSAAKEYYRYTNSNLSSSPSRYKSTLSIESTRNRMDEVTNQTNQVERLRINFLVNPSRWNNNTSNTRGKKRSHCTQQRHHSLL